MNVRIQKNIFLLFNMKEKFIMKLLFIRCLCGCMLVASMFISNSYALFYNFENGDQGWQQINGTCKVEKGEYVVTGNDGVGVLPDSDWKENWSDYTVECKAKMDQGPDNMGVLVRYQKPDTYYIFAIMNGRQQAEVWSRIAGAYTNHLNLPYPNKIGDVYIIKVIAEKDNFKFFINEELITEWSDNQLKTGKIGVRTYSSVSRFDDILITGAGIPKSSGEPGLVEPLSKLTITWGKLKIQPK